MIAVPSDADALIALPLRHAGADGVDDSHDFVAGYAGVLESRPMSIFHESIAVADAARGYLDKNLSRSGRRDFTFDEFERPAGAGDLSNTHL
jgi:hypothetical protein